MNSASENHVRFFALAPRWNPTEVQLLIEVDEDRPRTEDGRLRGLVVNGAWPILFCEDAAFIPRDGHDSVVLTHIVWRGDWPAGARDYNEAINLIEEQLAATKQEGVPIMSWDNIYRSDEVRRKGIEAVLRLEVGGKFLGAGLEAVKAGYRQGTPEHQAFVNAYINHLPDLIETEPGSLRIAKIEFDSRKCWYEVPSAPKQVTVRQQLDELLRITSAAPYPSPTADKFQARLDYLLAAVNGDPEPHPLDDDDWYVEVVGYDRPRVELAQGINGYGDGPAEYILKIEDLAGDGRFSERIDLIVASVNARLRADRELRAEREAETSPEL